MNVLILGSGGREHAFAWKLAQSPRVDKLVAIPGNGGIADIAECHTIPMAHDFGSLIDFVEAEHIDMTIVGPEAPLVDGVVDAFTARGHRIFGPDRSAARLEGSKAFAKHAMAKYGVPTAAFRVFNDPTEARAYIHEIGGPVVLKADGLAAGKGVMVCDTTADAEDALDRIMLHREFKEAGDTLVVEERLIGEEASFTLFCDGTTALPMATSQDHKPANDGDTGPNTGGMGAYSPAPVVDQALHDEVMRRVVHPLLDGLNRDGIRYTGILYVGLMVTSSGPKVLEFNCRLGDPETQAILPRLVTDLADLIDAAIDGRLADVEVQWRAEPCVSVVMASGGYPGKYETDVPIEGIEATLDLPDTVVFHAGTALKDGRLVTNGGRVLGITALGKDVRHAVDRAYEAVDRIHFDKAHYRRDIAHRALARMT